MAYSYGSINGTVPAGAQRHDLSAPGRNVTLTAMPNTVEIMFDGWTGGLTRLPSALAIQLQASCPSTRPCIVHASFATDYTDIRTFAVAAIGVFVAAAFVFVVRRGYTPGSGSRARLRAGRVFEVRFRCSPRKSGRPCHVDQPRKRIWGGKPALRPR